jgi:hypothetical protein
MLLLGGSASRFLPSHLLKALGGIRGLAPSGFRPPYTQGSASEHINFTFQAIEDIRRDEARIKVSLRRVSRSDPPADQ